jgi:hypothetical protein
LKVPLADKENDDLRTRTIDTKRHDSPAPNLIAADDPTTGISLSGFSIALYLSAAHNEGPTHAATS